MRTSMPAILATRHEVPNIAISSPQPVVSDVTRTFDSGSRRQCSALLQTVRGTQRRTPERRHDLGLPG
jgi:hypothetical protein